MTIAEMRRLLEGHPDEEEIRFLDRYNVPVQVLEFWERRASQGQPGQASPAIFISLDVLGQR